MAEPTLSDLIKQYIHDHGFTTALPMGYTHGREIFDVFKNKAKMGTFQVDEENLKIKFSHSSYKNKSEQISVYDPDSFPKIIERLRAIYAIERQGAVD